MRQAPTDAVYSAEMPLSLLELHLVLPALFHDPLSCLVACEGRVCEEITYRAWKRSVLMWGRKTNHKNCFLFPKKRDFYVLLLSLSSQEINRP
jgi:hypothetical protein